MNDSITACEAGRNFLLRELSKHVPSDETKVILSNYLHAVDGSETPKPIETIYFQLLVSAQNANMKANIIGGSIGGIEHLGKATFEFNPYRVLELFGEDHEKLFTHAMATLTPTGKLRDSAHSIWPAYCRSILSSASFLSQFKDGGDFFNWANHFYRDPRSMPVLPLLISQEIFGIGYPLACDFLKDLGFTGYGKPDIHIKRILLGLGFVEGGVSDYGAQKAIARIAADTGMTPYSVDKLFWLIGSGKLYNHPDLGKNGMIGRNGNKFLSETAPQMSWWHTGAECGVV